MRARKEADRIVEILKLAAAGDDSLLLTVRPEQLHQALISRNADPVFVQYAIIQCDVDGEYYSKFYEMCRGWSKDGEAEESARVAGASAAGRKDTRRSEKAEKPKWRRRHY